ncbi:hypothetical protein ACOMHN_031868 [Nucella lapillus]
MALPPYLLPGAGAHPHPLMGIPTFSPTLPYPPPSLAPFFLPPKLPARLCRKALPAHSHDFLHGAVSQLEDNFRFPVFEPKPDFEEEPQMELESKGLWERFHRAGNEMVVTRSGRRMFPTLKVKVSGLNKKTNYILLLDIVGLDNYRYKYQNGKWVKAGKADPVMPKRVYVHPDSPRSGAEWMQREVTFYKLKLSNSFSDRNGLGRDVTRRPPVCPVTPQRVPVTYQQ